MSLAGTNKKRDDLLDSPKSKGEKTHLLWTQHGRAASDRAMHERRETLNSAREATAGTIKVADSTPLWTG
ncbi:MAG TPA: hypothetical protein V6C97_03325 [Oculatellaceae cyanobacterium]